MKEKLNPLDDAGLFSRTIVRNSSVPHDSWHRLGSATLAPCSASHSLTSPHLHVLMETAVAPPRFDYR